MNTHTTSAAVHNSTAILQSFATLMGYNVGPVDGIHGAQTSAALQEMVADHPAIAHENFNNGASLTMDQVLIKQLGTDEDFRNTLTQNMQNILDGGSIDEIKAVQTLINTGLPPSMHIAVDGITGPQTAAAFEGFVEATIDHPTRDTLTSKFEGAAGELYAEQSASIHQSFGLDGTAPIPMAFNV